VARKNGKGLGVGDRVPSFELPDQSGEVVRLEDLLGKGPVVFFFYPADETPVCTREACSFRDAHEDLQRAGAQVFGISGDSVESHARFAARHKLPYRLLADVGDHVRDDVFGVPKGLLGIHAGRVTYVADGAGVIRKVFKSALQAQAHVDEALQVVQELAAG
jgi:thioredoxin-dependent peroxiredoxin